MSWSGEPVDLIKNGNSVAKLRLCYDRLAVKPATAAQEVDMFSLSTDALDGSVAQGVSRVSQLVENIGSGAKTAQSVYGDVNEVALYVSPLAQALGSLDQIIKIIDGVAEVNLFSSV
jgi:hypothetical protein